VTRSRTVLLPVFDRLKSSPQSRDAYYVQRVRGSKVTARIEALGLVPASIGDEQLAIQRLRRSLVVVGAWQVTPSGHHSRLRVAPAEIVTTQKVAPQSS